MQNTANFNIVIPIENAESRRQCGSKALTVGKLRRLGFAVPEGFCIGTDAYRLHLWGTGSRHLALSAPPEPERASLRRAIVESEIPTDVISAIEEAYQALGDDTVVSVRHSATDERSAGEKYVSVLGVRGLDALTDAVRQVWASLWCEEAAERRESDAKSWKEPAMGVIVQRMIDAKSSGTAITTNPTTGNPNEAVVRCTWGIGEADAPMDIAMVDLRTFRITYSEVAHKPSAIRIGPDGLVPEATTTLAAGTPSLSPEQIIELADSTIWIEKALGEVRACQWVYDGKDFCFIGAKTAGPIAGYFPVDAARYEANKQWRLAGAEPVSFFARSLSVFSMESLPSLSSANQNVALRCENGWIYRQIARPSLDADKLAAVKDVANGRRLHRKWKSAATRIVRDSRSDLAKEPSKLSQHNLMAVIQRAIARADESMMWFEVVSYPSLRFLYLLREALAFAGKDPALIGQLLREPDPLNSEKDSEFQRLSAYAWEAMLEGNDVPETILGEMASRFGYSFRSSRDARDPAAWRSWVENPELISKTALILAQGPLTDIGLAQKQALQDSKTAEKSVTTAIQSSYGALTRPIARIRFRLLLSLAKNWITAASGRNVVHALAISALRVYLIELGRRLEEVGAVSCPEDIFCLTVEEINRLGAKLEKVDAGSIRRLIAERKHELWLQGRLNAPRWLPPGAAPRETSSTPTEGGRTFTGIPTRPGEAIGSARVALTLEEASKLKPGEVLIVEEIGPAWTPLLGLASGLVMARGDLISPGAVAARDYGIPCVYGVSNATSAICTGQIVRVDGTTGEVEIVKRRSE